MADNRLAGALEAEVSPPPEKMSGCVTVSVRQGALRGRRNKTPQGQPFLSFQGIPYAQPPLGHRRFKPPVPLESWTGIRDATKPGNQSLQFDPASKKIVGDEDCLFLNVFTPRLPTGRKEEKQRAVLVWIHGGAFLVGSGDMYGPEPLLDHDVVVVTINYRLGPLGFLSLGTADAPGNAGLKDQTMALHWVKDNIHVFGGDPDNVTIFGESAGGTSVHYQVLSPLSKGLFRRAIAQSGSACMAWALSREPAGRAKRLALAAGCDWDTSEDAAALLKWLRAAPAEALVGAVEAAKTGEERRRGVLATFVPCVEPGAASDPFLPDEPDALLAQGAAQRVPIIFGLTSHEGIFLLPGSLLRLGLVPAPEAAAAAMARGDVAAAEALALTEAAGDLERLLPDKLVAGRPDPQRLQQTVQRVKDFYFNGRDLGNDTLEGYVHLNTDVSFALGSMRAAREHARLGARVYMYEFAFRGALNFLGPRVRSAVAGACHGDELGYLFTLPGQPPVDDGSPESLLRRRMGRLWTDFAKGGNPTPSLDEEITTTWHHFSASATNYLKISENLEAHTGFLKERMQFWDDLLGN